MVHLLTLYTDPERHDAQRYRRTDEQMTLWSDANSRSAKNRRVWKNWKS